MAGTAFAFCWGRAFRNMVSTTILKKEISTYDHNI